MEILDGVEPHDSPKTVDGLILLAREFGYNILIAYWARQLDVPRGNENASDLLQEFHTDVKMIIIKVDFRLFVTHLTSCNTTYRSSQKDFIGSLK
jgi:hypothetical protein